MSYEAYLRVREQVLRMKAAAAGTDPSAYWAQELENIDYMLEATPLIVAKLRQHAFHVTGIRPYDYRDKDDGRREHFLQRLHALRELGGDALLVPESPALGGFGYEVDGRLFNVDTIKFLEVLVGMERGGVLRELRALDRLVVCEVGAGWGGFAYQFKTLFPRASYVIVDFPELFLFSATYLATLFPSARMIFCESGDADATVDGWEQADFVFVPSTHARATSALPLNLMVNMVSFQEMTDTQVSNYARMAADARCPLLYSLNRERSPYNRELTSVSGALAEYYRLTEVPLLDTDYTSAMKKPPKAGRPAARSELAYRHLVGHLKPSAANRSTRSQDRAGVGAPRVVLGMTLYNQAAHLREALDSLLGQTYDAFLLILLDDASSDDTEAIAREYETRDRRVRYFRHASRRAMVATWREVVEIAARECPGADYFAWVSDHDRWHPRWLERLLAELDADSEAVLAYPVTRRIGQTGEEFDKGPRLFDTAACRTLSERWAHFCRHGVGAGDMVYGLMRLAALRRAGIFRAVLRPDRLLIAELTLLGRIRQVPEVLWFRRQSGQASIQRQHHTLVLSAEEPRWFSLPPWLQHSLVLWQEYARPDNPPLPVSRAEWRRMLLRYQAAYGWRHLRKSETSHVLAKTISRALWTRKMVRHIFHHAVYHTLVGGRRFWGTTRRGGRRAVYELLMVTHRLGLRGRGESPSSR